MSLAWYLPCMLQMRSLLGLLPEPNAEVPTIESWSFWMSMLLRIHLWMPLENGSRKRPGRAEREETVLLRSGGEETVLLRPAEPEAVLIRLSTGEVWQVRGPAFRIGKDPEKNQCCVAENPAVSRHHAAIMQRGGAFYLTDLGSTNLTRLEGRLVEKNVEMRLENGAVFTVADEAFRFEEKEREEWNT